MKVTQQYEKCDLFCPNCGKQEVWEEKGLGDYYLGVNYLCLSCETSHNLDNTYGELCKTSKGIIEQLRSGVKNEPYEEKVEKGVMQDELDKYMDSVFKKLEKQLYGS
jgi:hypothetical protein